MAEILCPCGRAVKVTKQQLELGHIYYCPKCGHKLDPYQEIEEEEDEEEEPKPRRPKRKKAADPDWGDLPAPTVGLPKPKKKKSRPVTVIDSPEPQLSAGDRVVKLLMYPVNGDGVWTVGVWTCMFGLLNAFYNLLPVMAAKVGGGLFGFVLWVLGFFLPFVWLILNAYLVHYLLQVLRWSARGEPEPPDPTASGGELGWDLFLWFCVAMLAFLPLAAYSIFCWWNDIEQNPYAFWGLILLTILYAPMALLSVTLHDHPLAANPLIVFGAIFRMPGSYLLTCVLILIVLVGEVIYLVLVPWIPVIQELMAWGVGLYASMLIMHLLGDAYYRRRHDVSWFRD